MLRWKLQEVVINLSTKSFLKTTWPLRGTLSSTRPVHVKCMLTVERPLHVVGFQAHSCRHQCLVIRGILCYKVNSIFFKIM